MAKEDEKSIDYYKILECERDASFEVLKMNYQRLVLKLHPDKANHNVDHKEDDFLKLQEAWLVLRDAQSRKQYDAELFCSEHDDNLLYETLTLKDMNFDSSNNIFLYSCRCGGSYLLEGSDLSQSKVLIPCDECSFSIEVTINS